MHFAEAKGIVRHTFIRKPEAKQQLVPPMTHRPLFLVERRKGLLDYPLI